MFKHLILAAMLMAAATGLAQTQHKLPSNDQLLSQATSFYIESRTFYMKPEQLQSALLHHSEFKDWDLQITENKKLADIVISVRRVQFQNNFDYTLTDQATGTIVMAGQVNSLFGTVYGKIANDIVGKLKKIRTSSTPQPSPQKEPTAEKNSDQTSS